MGEGDDDTRAEEVASPTSTLSDDKKEIIIAPIQVIIKDLSEDEYDDEDEEDEDFDSNQKRKGGLDKTMLLTKTFGQAIKLIREQKVEISELVAVYDRLNAKNPIFETCY